jgi:ribosome-associated translation inhibitor RaiA
MEDGMQIQINTDNKVDGHEKLAHYVRGVVEGAVGRFSQHITRVEVHLADENGAHTGPEEKRCMMEVRVESRHPIAVTHHATTLGLAVDGAAGKLKRSIEHDLHRLRGRRH